MSTAEEWGNVMADSLVLGLPAPLPGEITLAEAKKNAQDAAKKGADAKKAADAKKLAEAKAKAAAQQAAQAAEAAKAQQAASSQAGGGINWQKVAVAAGVVLAVGGIVIGGVWYATRK